MSPLQCLTLCDPMDCSLPGSSVHGIPHGAGGHLVNVLRTGRRVGSHSGSWRQGGPGNRLLAPVPTGRAGEQSTLSPPANRSPPLSLKATSIRVGTRRSWSGCIHPGAQRGQFTCPGAVRPRLAACVTYHSTRPGPLPRGRGECLVPATRWA